MYAVQVLLFAPIIRHEAGHKHFQDRFSYSISIAWGIIPLPTISLEKLLFFFTGDWRIDQYLLFTVCFKVVHYNFWARLA